jgi:membrane-associated phospholipid phosphatase
MSVLEPIKRFGRAYWQELLTVLMFVVWSGGYLIIAQSIDPSHTEHIDMRVDHKIPFIPQFVFIYIGLYTMYVYPYLLVRDKDFFKVFTGAYITVMIIVYSIFLLFPVSIVRPQIEVTDFSTWTLSIVYSLDKPVNCFPSSHVAMTMLSALTIWEINRFYGIFAILYALGIAVSTLFLKQHYVLDVVAALFITGIVYYAYFKQRITQVLGRNLRVWEQEMLNNFVHRTTARIEPIVDRIITKKVDEAVQNALKNYTGKKPEK